MVYTLIMARQPTVRSWAATILIIAASFAAATDDCHLEPSPNLVVNPSWEDGLDGWNYVYPHSISTAEHSDGASSL